MRWIILALLLSACTQPTDQQALPIPNADASAELIEQTFSLRFIDDQPDLKNIEVEQGSSVTLHVSNLENATLFFYVRGYLEEKIPAGRTTEIAFAADRAGRFEYGSMDSTIKGILAVNS
jgi:hypothetical protein